MGHVGVEAGCCNLIGPTSQALPAACGGGGSQRCRSAYPCAVSCERSEASICRQAASSDCPAAVSSLGVIQQWMSPRYEGLCHSPPSRLLPMPGRVPCCDNHASAAAATACKIRQVGAQLHLTLDTSGNKACVRIATRIQDYLNLFVRHDAVQHCCSSTHLWQAR